MRPTTTKTFVAVAMLALTGGACSGDAVTDEKAGAGDAKPVALRLGAVENSAVPYADEVKEFAKAIEALSDGSIDVEVVWDAAGPFSAEIEHDLAAMVSRGEFDLAVVPSRGWGELGVTSFDALQAPFLVDDLGLLAEIAGSDVGAEMLEGLAPVGVEGLAIWPESLRHPVSFDQPLVTVADFRGAKLRVPNSAVSRSVMQAIGVEPVFPADPSAAVAAGEMDGAESGFVWAEHLPMYGTFTANVTFYPKANVVAANVDVFDSLSDDHQDVLRQAATDTLAYVVASNASERDLAAQYCADGGSVALAAATDVAELVTLAEPIYSEISKNADSARLLDEIGAIKDARTVDADLPEACQPVAVESTVVSSGAFPEGVYRTESPLDGIVTFEFRDGKWKRYFENGDLDCVATYVVTSGRIHLTLSTDPQHACGTVPGTEFLDAAWTLEGDQLRIVDINSDPAAKREFSLPWTKID